MKILITNNSLANRGGAQTCVRNLARALESMGHSVLAYSCDPSQHERLLENDVVPVATDLETLPFLPDVIHGQHHLNTMSAVTALAGVPAIYHCHGATWQDCVVKHPRIYHYLAISRTMAERIMAESNIPHSDITVLLNGVDLARFRHVRTLPPRPARALLFNSRYRPESDTVSAIREASERAGLELDLVGYYFGRKTDQPEKLLPEYDVVFASGLSAIEALASGCAVVVLGRTSCGEMVLPENFDRLRQVNFSIATNSPPPSAERIGSELRRFSAEDCALVTARLRREADFQDSARKLVEIYEQVIERHRNSRQDLPAEAVATSRYLRKIAPLIKATDNVLGKKWSSHDPADSFDELSARVALVEQELKRRQ